MFSISFQLKLSHKTLVYAFTNYQFTSKWGKHRNNIRHIIIIRYSVKKHADKMHHIYKYMFDPEILIYESLTRTKPKNHLSLNFYYVKIIFWQTNWILITLDEIRISLLRFLYRKRKNCASKTFSKQKHELCKCFFLIILIKTR